MKASKGNGGTGPFILTVAARQRGEVNVRLLKLYRRERASIFIDWEVGWASELV